MPSGGSSPLRSNSMTVSSKFCLMRASRRIEGDYLSLVDHGHAVAKRFGLFEIVSGKKTVAPRAGYHVWCPTYRAWPAGRARSRFIEEDNFGLVDEGERDRQALPLAAGKSRHWVFCFLAQVNRINQVVRAQGSPEKKLPNRSSTSRTVRRG